jgi:DNA-binding transcriptional regulator YiaG
MPQRVNVTRNAKRSEGLGSSRGGEEVEDQGNLELLLKQAHGRAAGWAIREARQSLGLSQGDFAELLSATDEVGSVKQTTLNGWELGSRQPPIEAVIAAARLAGISIVEALNGPSQTTLRRRLDQTIKARRLLSANSAALKRIDREISNLRERLKLTGQRA